MRAPATPRRAAPRLQRPIFVNAFSRGGSSIVWNLLASHPDAVSPLEETHQLFVGNVDRGNAVTKARAHLGHAWRGGGLPRPRLVAGHLFPNAGLFDPANFAPRSIPARLHPEVDRVLDAAKGASLDHPDLGRRTPGEAYAAADVAAARLVSKNINGIVFLSASLAAMYPDATFVGLVRDGLSLCEGRMRRQSFRSAHKFGAVYAMVAAELANQQDRLEHCRLFRFEDLLDDPACFLGQLYAFAGLDGGALTHVRLKNKAHYAGGGYGREAGPGEYRWIPVAELGSFLHAGVDAEQRRRLGASDRDAFLSTGGAAMERLGYR